MDDRYFFDKIADKWDDNEILSTPEKINEILDLLDLKKGQNILDLGTGTGVLLPYIAQRIGEEGSITAVDFSEGMLNQAKKKFSHILPTPLFLNIDFENETIPGEFDHIILYCVYPHLHSPIDTLKWLQKVNLKKNGVITVAFPCGPEFINNIHKERKSESDLLPSADELSKFFTDNNLQAHVIANSKDKYIINIYQ